MTTPQFPDPVPLGVHGAVTIPLAHFESLAGERPAVLLDDEQRHEYIAQRLWEAVDRSPAGPFAIGLVRQMLVSFRDTDVMAHAAAKALDTLRDGDIHDGALFSPTDPTLAVLFIAWPGSPLDVQTERFGRYLTSLFDVGTRFVESGTNLLGVIQIDAFLRDTSTETEPGRPLDEVFEVAVELSYLPGWAVGSVVPRVPLYSDHILIDEALCDDADRERLASLEVQQQRESDPMSPL